MDYSSNFQGEPFVGNAMIYFHPVHQRLMDVLPDLSGIVVGANSFGLHRRDQLDQEQL